MRFSKTRMITIVIAIVAVMLPSVALAGGFDELGYNDKARLFNGPADGTDGVLNNAVWGDPTYANDHLVMNWNAEWDRGNAEGWSDPDGYSGANISNHWNGQVPDGSGEVWHYKIVWVGNCVADPSLVPDGGYCVWGQFAVIFSHGTYLNQHFWDAHANPTGFGAY